ncbi:RICIN domain-containing protein [Lentzea cavernae]|uniref:Ricin B lectin domain-containing protein n=1 Tax=Lentzea cavernae TaxID=2020703 RepID=A0ABQ3MLH9_9PSEU|nr:RICIN domain-containing protein [Lentzea cavernae]GHH42558.1 hypothetical protein GCM10017774_39130 [Lentzea cavernae]
MRNLRAHLIGVAGALALLLPALGASASGAVGVAQSPPADTGSGVQGKSGGVGVAAVYGPFNVRAQNSNKCLDVSGGTGSTGNGAGAIIWDCYGPAQTNQQWYFQETGDPFVYNLVARHSNKCLDIAGGTAAVHNGAPAQQWGCLGYYQTNQKWYLSSYSANGMTIYKLTAMHSGKCLDVTGGTGSITNGIPVQQWQCLGDVQTNQRWYLTAP